MATAAETEQGRLTPFHDVPEALVSFVLDGLYGSTIAPVIAESWDRTATSPELRRFISQAGFELAPADLELRGKVIRAMLGLLAIEDGSDFVSNSEAAFNSPDATHDGTYQLSLHLAPGLPQAA